MGKAIPYGVFDLERNEGWVSVGIDHDPATFAVRAMRRWWTVMGRPAYRRATSLRITADCGASNGARVRLWKWELQQFADRTGLALTVCHFPPVTSKWNKIEHRLFSPIAMNWRGKPLVSLAVIVSLIGATTSTRGLRVRSELGKGRYPDGVRVTDEQMAQVRLEPHEFHGEWNYTIRPASEAVSLSQLFRHGSLLLWWPSPSSGFRRIQPMKIAGINWAGVRTNSFESMKQFAEQTLGLSAVHESRDFVVYRLPNGDKFEIFGPKSPFAPEQFAHNEVVCGFRVDDIDRAREELQAADIELLGPVHRDSPGGYAWQHFRVPDGKVFELSYEPDPR